MSTVATFRAPADDVLLGTAFERLPSLSVALESSITRSFPALWIRGCRPVTLDEALAADPSVIDAECLLSVDDRLLYDVTPAEEHRRIVRSFVEGGGAVLDGAAADARWEFEVRFLDRRALSRTHDRLVDAGVSLEVTRVSDRRGLADDGTRLTPQQREALSTALERGYFEIPRETSMEELAEELGISHQALSERLRRAYESLVDAELRPTATR